MVLLESCLKCSSVGKIKEMGKSTFFTKKYSNCLLIKAGVEDPFRSAKEDGKFVRIPTGKE